MTFTQRFKLGLDYGLNSFSLLKKNPKLLIYLGIPIFIGITIELIIYNLFFFSSASTALFVDGLMMRMWATFGWSRHIGIIITDTIRLFVTIFSTVALIQHVDHIMRGEQTTIQQIIKQTLPQWKQIFFWALIATLFSTLLYPIDQVINTSTCSSCYTLAFIMSALLRISWSLATAFVVVCIALENLSLRRIMTLAPSITKAMLYEYLGAICWIGLIIVLGMIPFVLFYFTSQVGQTIGYITLMIGSCVLSTVYAILQVTLYRVYKNASLWETVLMVPPL